MKNLRNTLVLIFVLAISMAFAQENPYLLMDEPDQTELMLKIENYCDAQTVPFQRNSTEDDETNLLNINIDAESMDEFEDKMTLNNDLVNGFEQAFAKHSNCTGSDKILFSIVSVKQAAILDFEYS